MAGSGSSYDAGKDAALTTGFSQTGDARADEVSNRTGGGYDERDAMKETSSSGSEVEAAWHQARDDDEQASGRDDRHTGGWGTGNSRR